MKEMRWQQILELPMAWRGVTWRKAVEEAIRRITFITSSCFDELGEVR